VTRTATEQEIRRAFQKLAAEFHAAGKPRNIDDVEKIRAIATAYRVLSDGENDVLRRFEDLYKNWDAGDIF
jgi:DnaJ-class molecular chaperone